MTALRTRFIEDMQLHGYSPKTQSCYVGAVCGLAKHYHKSPDLISEEELRRYFLFLTLQKKVARATATIALCGIKFLFQNTLQRNWTCFKLLRPPREKKLPVVLSQQEVQKILPCVRTPMYRVCLTTIYSCGLRLSEGLFLRVRDAFLVPGFALSKIFRGKFRAGLKKLGLLGQIPSAVWQQNGADQLEQARSLLAVESSNAQPAASPLPQQLSSPSQTLQLCPRCKIGHLVLVASLLPQQTRGP